jgi:hypothetical protein
VGLRRSGFVAVLDYQRNLKPVRVNLETGARPGRSQQPRAQTRMRRTGEIENEERRVFEFQIDFPKPHIRR